MGPSIDRGLSTGTDGLWWQDPPKSDDMRMSSETVSSPVPVQQRRRTWPPLAIALACIAAYVLVLGWPYVAAERSGIPMSHGASEWSQTQPEPLALILLLAVLFTVFFVPFAGIAVAAWAGRWLVLDWTVLRGRDRALLLAGTGAGLAVFGFVASPLFRDINAWWLG